MICRLFPTPAKYTIGMKYADGNCAVILEGEFHSGHSKL